jgi:hypothetical protein
MVLSLGTFCNADVTVLVIAAPEITFSFIQMLVRANYENYSSDYSS